MKNQYSFVKSIDHMSASATTSSSNSNSPQQQQAEDSKRSGPNRPPPPPAAKSSLSKLHNLVASRFQIGHQQVAGQPQQQPQASNCSSQVKGQPSQRVGRVFSLGSPAPTNSGGRTKLSPAGGDEQDKKQQVIAADAATTKSPLAPQPANKSLQQAMEARSAPASAAPANNNTSEKMTPELAMCYDEIDQIYDYIRGLAPLPVQLRKIKSIDFEQLERENRLKELQQQQQQQQLNGTAKPLSNPNTASGEVPKQRSSKARQREAPAAGDEPLREPQLGRPSQQRVVQGPLPIKVTTCEAGARPVNVKRVESLNLGLSAELRNRVAGGDQLGRPQPSYLIGGAQRGQLFRLPRAHSTSTLNKPAEQQAVARQRRRVLGQQQQQVAPATHTLPALRLSRISALPQPSDEGQSASLNRMKPSEEQRRRERLASGGSSSAAQRLAAKLLGNSRPGKALDLVESFVDDDDVSSVASRRSSAASSGSSSATSASTSSAGNMSASTGASSSSSTSGSGDSESSDSESVTSGSSSSDSSGARRSQRPSRNPTSRSSGSMADKWATEKSHSDYENDTVSLTTTTTTTTTTSGSPSDLLGASSRSSRRRSSSGAGTGTGGSQQERHSSTSASSSARNSPVKQKQQQSRRSASASANDADQSEPKAEHIYEQIPAHKNLLIGLKPTQQQPSISQSPAVQMQQHNRGPIKQSYSQLRSSQHQQQQQPFNYPVAYAPTVAPSKHQQVAAFLAASPAAAAAHHNMAAAIHQRHQQQQAASGGTFPLAPPPLASVHSLPPQARPLDHRHRLSMSNLHLLPYLKHPLLVGLYPPPNHQQQHQAAAAAAAAAVAAKLSRSSSSSKVNRLRAPRLSPGQLIAQIQMPRAVSKRQLQQPAEFTASSQHLAATSVDLHRHHHPHHNHPHHNHPHHHHQHQHQQHNFGVHHHPSLYLWQRPSPQNSGLQPIQTVNTVTTSQVQQQQQRAAPSSRAYAPAKQLPPFISRASSKRNSSRRLTAIGIEEALEGVRREPLTPLRPATGAAPLKETNLNGGSRFEAGHRRSSSYFEAADLLKSAPLIDDDDDEETTGSDGSRAHKKEKVALKNRLCLNSISDLHSFSSTSADDDDGEEQDEGGDESQPSSSGSLVGRRSKFLRRPKRQDKTKDEGNFVSSSSFIKCYYGRERRQSEGAQAQTAARAESETKDSHKRQKKRQVEEPAPAPALEAAEVRSKKRGSEKLLGLIGLNTGSARRAASKPAAAVEPSQQQQRSTMASPIVALFTGSSQRSSPGAKSRANQPQLMGEFLNAEGPILVRDQRIASLRSDLVRHYEHPTVQVTSVPSYDQRVQQKLRQQQLESRATVAGADSRPLHRRFVSMLDQTGSTNTTNSTSSYEAAIKNSRNITPPPPAKETGSSENQPPAQRASSSSKKSSTSGGGGAQSALIKVPKLSKQSHLLNRPLPKPPTQSSGSSSSSRRAAAAASGSSGNRQPASLLSKRKLLLATNMGMASDLLGHAVGSGGGGDSDSKRSARRSAAPTLGQASSRSSGGGGGSSQLYPLQVAVIGGTQPSPTVTTCTSSGISSRLTSGTHLPGSNGSSSQRSASSQQQHRVKSLSELHKQSKQLQQQQQQRLSGAIDEPAFASTLGSTSGVTSSAHSAPVKAPDFALMDESDCGDAPSPIRLDSQQPIHQQQAAADESHAEKGRRRDKGKQQVATSNGARLLAPRGDEAGEKSRDAVEQHQQQQQQAAQRKEIRSAREEVNSPISATDANDQQQAIITSNLKLFDERFSSKFADQQLASSSDSLLESINFSGTLNGKSSLASAGGKRA